MTTRTIRLMLAAMTSLAPAGAWLSSTDIARRYGIGRGDAWAHLCDLEIRGLVEHSGGPPNGRRWRIVKRERRKAAPVPVAVVDVAELRRKALAAACARAGV